MYKLLGTILLVRISVANKSNTQLELPQIITRLQFEMQSCSHGVDDTKNYNFSTRRHMCPCWLFGVSDWATAG